MLLIYCKCALYSHVQFFFVPGFGKVMEYLSFVYGIDNSVHISITRKQYAHWIRMLFKYGFQEFHSCYFRHSLVCNYYLYIIAVQYFNSILSIDCSKYLILYAKGSFEGNKVILFIIYIKHFYL